VFILFCLSISLSYLAFAYHSRYYFDQMTLNFLSHFMFFYLFLIFPSVFVLLSILFLFFSLILSLNFRHFLSDAQLATIDPVSAPASNKNNYWKEEDRRRRQKVKRMNKEVTKETIFLSFSLTYGAAKNYLLKK